MDFSGTEFTYVATERSEAKKIGQKKYPSGNRGGMIHTCWKLTSSNICSECMRIRYSTNKRYRECRRLSVKKSKMRPEYRKRANERKRERYATDEGFRNREKHISRVGARKRRKTNPDKAKEIDGRKYRKMKTTDRGRSELAWRTLLQRCIRAGWKKQHSTSEELGYTPEDLRSHIESIFEDGMSWRNHGEWHIDHRRPISSFPVGTHPCVVNALDNLQPLWAEDNLRKYTAWDEQ